MAVKEPSTKLHKEQCQNMNFAFNKAKQEAERQRIDAEEIHYNKILSASFDIIKKRVSPQIVKSLSKGVWWK